MRKLRPVIPDHLLNDQHKTDLFKEFLKEWQ